VLRRVGLGKLSRLDQPEPANRYEHARPGALLHVDIKKLGRIPDGGGWKAHGRDSDQARRVGIARKRAKRRGESSSRGYTFLHHAVDDCTRLVYSEQLPDERKETAAAFWTRAQAFFATAGITVTAVMTDNGACYRSHAFAAALGNDITHRRTRPFRPQTNGKVERFNRTLAAEWAYAETYISDPARAATYADWLHHYNHHRPHTALGGSTPANRVHNLTGNYT